MTRVRTIFGTMLAFSDDHITRHMRTFGAHTRPELAFLRSVVRAGDRIFDLGAHVGSFAIPLARKAGTAGAVLAVEAAPKTFALLERNISLNDLNGTVAARRALVAPAGDYEAVTQPGNTGATFFRPSTTRWDGTCVTIDELVSQAFCPDVIKTDLEGFDVWALCSSTTVRRRLPAIYAEISPIELARCGASASVLSGFLTELGYRLFRNAGERHAAHDDFVVEELETIATEKAFDVLALHRDDDRIGDLWSAFRAITANRRETAEYDRSTPP